MIFIDTHVAVWLFYGRKDEFSDTAREAIENNDLRLSPMSCLELNYLHEVGKIANDMQCILPVLTTSFAVEVHESNFWLVIQESASLQWTRDPFDRLICAQAVLEGRKLLTRDRNILSNFKQAFW
ncbi:MAG: type II toxin-antitoxin system VapC family toxin [Planctomycetes bacterium]|nr:type II toxin-antitoxin system VapC family toxin [Planctomycetota bacterium]